MEDKITSELEGLDLEQTEKLLTEDMDMNIGALQKQRIKAAVYRKTGLRSRPKIYSARRLTACLAALAIIITAVSVVGFDKVYAAIGRAFSFIPGYAIVENNTGIDYVLQKPVTAENAEAKLMLSSAVATKKGITVMFTLDRKNYVEQQLVKDKQEEWERLKNGGKPSRAEVLLWAGDRKIEEYSGSTGSSGRSDTSTLTFELNPSEIGTNRAYKLEYKAYGLSLEFKLRDYDSYEKLEEIGATDYNNDISITAVPSFPDGKLQVDLYTINKSPYSLDSLGAGGAALNKDIYVETNSGIKEGYVPYGYGGANGRFMFDIEPEDNDFKLKIPGVTVKSDEKHNISLKIPKEGEKLTVNQRVEFKDGVMTITEVERTKPQREGDFGALKMTIKYESKADNKILLHPEFLRTDLFGNTKGGGWSAEMDENGAYKEVYYSLEKGENDLLRLKVYNPVYFLKDEYSLSFSR